MGLNALVHDLVQLVDVLLERLLDGGVIAIPITLDAHLAGRDVYGKVMRRRQLVDTLEEGLSVAEYCSVMYGRRAFC